MVPTRHQRPPCARRQVTTPIPWPRSALASTRSTSAVQRSAWWKPNRATVATPCRTAGSTRDSIIGITSSASVGISTRAWKHRGAPKVSITTDSSGTNPSTSGTVASRSSGVRAT
ncbi:hypothetical protein NOMA109596_19000 [Nocardioides marinus]